MSAAVRLRLFVAVEVGEPAKAALARAVEPYRPRHPGLRWVEPGQWHITLAFVGGVLAERAATAGEVTAAAVRGAAPLRLKLDGGVGTFDGRALWVGVEHHDGLKELADGLVERLAETGFAMETRRFVPHCTIARTPRGAWLPAELTNELRPPVVAWTAKQVTLLRSRLRIGGAVHEAHSVFPLDGASS
ncbi:RNA 2',3'-cyclic phosphodiesterase [soil metagenome]